ncbi:imm11 family protein [Pseudocolwellia sp. HL-MZ7]|uniref:imm11 family protein n=1 Tax=Pseudocolwellia sp. HL-MZ7 TaxID=3400627 RepID=UPI003CF2BECC
MKLFSLKPVTNSYDMVEWDILSFSERIQPMLPSNQDACMFLLDIHMNNDSLLKYWPQSYELSFLPGYLKDNYDISIMDGFIALRMNAYEALKDLLAPLGEFIETKADGEPIVIFNLRTFGQEDEAKCEREYLDGYPLDYIKIAFINDDVKNKPVFKSKLTGGARLFCTDKFKSAVEGNGLTGVFIDEDLDNIFSN